MKDIKHDLVVMGATGFTGKLVVEYLIKNKIPVMGHIGITPQSVRGKFKYKGKSDIEKKVIEMLERKK